MRGGGAAPKEVRAPVRPGIGPPSRLIRAMPRAVARAMPLVRHADRALISVKDLTEHSLRRGQGRISTREPADPRPAYSAAVPLSAWR
ncbi:MAG: hypothetical protein HLUCCA08_00525 [Rhodobacteraceae bacterium HLUCCA08]|nr:MAG: hypothetical protein HLUCCA08_00525 [Rhodobacteraceae bacterium HLUCCA08]